MCSTYITWNVFVGELYPPSCGPLRVADPASITLLDLFILKIPETGIIEASRFPSISARLVYFWSNDCPSLTVKHATSCPSTSVPSDLNQPNPPTCANILCSHCICIPINPSSRQCMISFWCIVTLRIPRSENLAAVPYRRTRRRLLILFLKILLCSSGFAKSDMTAQLEGKLTAKSKDNFDVLTPSRY